MLRSVVSVCLLLLAALLVAGCGKKTTVEGQNESPVVEQDSLQKKSRTVTDNKPTVTANGNNSDLQPHTPPDFSKVDYTFDFSKVNYKPVDFAALNYLQGPQGEPVVERKGTHPKEKDSPYWGKPFLERGYTSKSGEFIRHGVMTTWQPGGISKTNEKKYEEVQYFNGKRHGAFIAWDKNGNKEEEGFAVDGKIHGQRTGLYPSGKKKTESYFISGKQHGQSEAWHENGQLMAQGQFVDGLRHGRFLRWHPNGAKDDVECYVGGKMHGPLTVWYPNGQIKVESVFMDGKQEARRQEWHENGQKALEVVFIDGLAQGKNLQWHPNGKVFNEGLWKDGKEEGIWIRWHPNGGKQSQVEFIGGQRQGPLESWYENGQPDETATFVKGKKNGKNTRYCPNGKLLFEHQYLDGKMHGLCIDYEGTGSGRVVKAVNYRNGLPTQ